MDGSLREEKIRKVVEQRQEGIIILEDIYDPHNAAAVIRTAEAFGFHKICFIFDKEEKFNPRQVGKVSSASGNKWVDFKTFRSTEECLEEVKNEGFEVVATLLDETAEDLLEAKLEERKLAIMLGNEHRGLSETAAKLADRKIYIPMRGMVQSLNLSVTAAIMMFEVTRQREKLGKEGFLLEEKEKLVEDFLKR